jgi:hypothetical protein
VQARASARWRPALLAAFALAAAPARADDTETLRLAAEHLVVSQLRSGLFTYDFDVASAEPTGQDNVVRQAGALSALGDYVTEARHPQVEAALRAGLEALAGRSLPTGRRRMQSLLERLGLFGGGSRRRERALGALGLLQRPDGDGLLVAENGGEAPAGATALALIAELGYRRATGDERFAAVREAWKRGLLALHVRGSGIRAHPRTLRRSAYYEGEAWLAFARLHSALPEDAQVADALRALEPVLMERYGESPTKSFYHWGARASAERYRSSGDVRFVDFAARQARWALAALPPARFRHGNPCWLVEGLASAHPLLVERPADAALAELVRERVAAELERSRALQIRRDQDRLPLAKGGVLIAPVLRDHAGAFRAGRYSPYLRIDLTQHCIAALLAARASGLSPREPAAGL